MPIIDNTELSLGQAVGKPVELYIDKRSLNDDIRLRRRVIAAIPACCRYINLETGEIPVLETLQSVLEYLDEKPDVA